MSEQAPDSSISATRSPTGEWIYAGGRRWADLSREERRARIVGNSLENDEEDIEFWRSATEEQRGRTLYGLLAFADRVLRSRPPLPEEPLVFPGFPRLRDRNHSPQQ
jgi:hypothetical protein